MLVTLPTIAKRHVKCAYQVTDAAYMNICVTDTIAQCTSYWGKRCQWCAIVCIDPYPYLTDISHKLILCKSMCFPGFIRNRSAVRVQQFGISEVGTLLCTINKTIEVDSGK